MIVYSESEFIEQTIKRRKMEKVVCDWCKKEVDSLIFQVFVRNSDLLDGVETEVCPCCLSSAVDDALKCANDVNFNFNINTYELSELPPYESVWSAFDELNKEESDDE